MYNIVYSILCTILTMHSIVYNMVCSKVYSVVFINYCVTICKSKIELNEDAERLVYNRVLLVSLTRLMFLGSGLRIISVCAWNPDQGLIIET